MYTAETALSAGRFDQTTEFVAGIVVTNLRNEANPSAFEGGTPALHAREALRKSALRGTQI